MKRTLRYVLVAGVLVAAALPLGISYAAPAKKTQGATPTSQYVANTGDDEANGAVIGGELASVKDYPHIILGTRDGGPRPQGAACTGSLVAPRKVLIAGHCKDASGTKHFLYGLDNFKDATGGTWAEVVEYKQHPQYAGWQGGYDAAIVTLDRDLPLPAGFRYPRVADSNDSGLTPVGTNALFVGYGRVALDENYSSELRKTTLPFVNGSGCQSFNSSYNSDLMLCAGFGQGSSNYTGICQGDSGGPLTVNGVIVGLASFVRTGCTDYGGFARMNGPIGDWVNKEIGSGPAPTCPAVSNATDVAIPDKGAAVTSEVTVSGCSGSASGAAKVEVHVAHSWRGDLVVDLVAPDGSVYSLKKASAGDGAVNLDATYTADLSSETANGTWKLRVQDVYAYDTGHIDTWTLTV